MEKNVFIILHFSNPPTYKLVSLNQYIEYVA